MESIFEQFTIIYELAKYVNWNDIHSLKKINKLCDEVCEREIVRRCQGVMSGYISLSSTNCGNPKRRRCAISLSERLLSGLQFHRPRVLFLFTNKKNLLGIEEIIERQCNNESIVCMLYSTRGCFGIPNGLQLQLEMCTRQAGLWWMSLPADVDARVVSMDNEIPDDCKVVIVINSSLAASTYPRRVFSDDEDDEFRYPPRPLDVIYCGGLARALSLYNHRDRCFQKLDHLSVALSGPDLLVTHLILDEGTFESPDVLEHLKQLRMRTEAAVEARGRPVRHQVVLVFSCYLRSGCGPSRGAEYGLVGEAFPGVAVQGLLCEGEVFHRQEGLLRLVRPLHGDDLRGVTSIYLVLTWTVLS